jgi:hypothetical protein
MTGGSFPEWLHDFAIVSIAIGCVCALIICVDEVRRPQKMWIMNLVWPLTSLFGSLLWLWFYFRWGRGASQSGDAAQTPFVVQVANGTSHCGAGCTLGDVVAEWAAFWVAYSHGVDYGAHYPWSSYSACRRRWSSATC